MKMEPMALIIHPARFDDTRECLLQGPIDCPESKLPIALAQGWIVLVKESDVMSHVEVPVQSNPVRHDDSDLRKGAVGE